MEKYNPQKIEKKWQQKWQESELYQADLDHAKKPFYNLMMFPYPSAEGLHVGNMYAFTHSDAYGRFMRLKGFDVFEPIGLDGFGIHSENYAIKIGEHIKKVSARTEKHFYEQLHAIGNQYDWSRKLETYDPNYYRWTQWLFLKMYDAGLAYRKASLVNWCPSCKTVLSDEQIINGECERCGNKTVMKQMEQWFFKITDFAEKLLNNLETIDWTPEVKTIQRNWIGKSEGTEFDLAIKNSSEKIRVFTTRIDTVFGMTYVVVAPEHPLVSEILNSKFSILNLKEVEKYIEAASKKTEIQRADMTKEKTGVELKGIKAINPFTKEEIPVFVADYVLGHYGTGAVMAVPAHDERDWEFAKKYNLPIKEVIMPVLGEPHENAIRRETISPIVQRKSDGKYLFLQMKGAHAGAVTTIIGGVEDGESIEEAAIRETLEETGYETKFVKKLGEKLESHFYQAHKKEWRMRIDQPVVLELIDEATVHDVSEEEKTLREIVWLTEEEVYKKLPYESDIIRMNRFLGKNTAHTNDGRLINSGEYDELTSEQAREKMTAWLEKEKIGQKKVNYKLRDWCVSRQRYWGPPIPMIQCEKCGWVPVPESDLPVLLPEMEDFLPDGTGKGPLNKVPEFVNTTCPKCGGPAKRETDVSDPFVDSCWYYLRYPSTEQTDRAFDPKRLKKWMPVDMYIGGKEHSVLHLLYSRFVTMVLNQLGYVPVEEPFKRFRAHGLLIKDGAKMSKSKGNVINPDDYINQFGADSVRLYLMFLGDMRQGGDWRDSGMMGMVRFVNRIWQLQEKIVDQDQLGNLMHKTVKGVTDDLENLKYNTSIAKLMMVANKIQEVGCSKAEFEKLLIMLSPFAPFVTEELWSKLGHAESIFKNPWPKYDPELIKDELIHLVVQVNGKVRDMIETSVDIDEDNAKKLAITSEKVQKFLAGKEIRKVIFVKGRLINVVV